MTHDIGKKRCTDLGQLIKKFKKILIVIKFSILILLYFVLIYFRFYTLIFIFWIFFIFKGIIRKTKSSKITDLGQSIRYKKNSNQIFYTHKKFLYFGIFYISSTNSWNKNLKNVYFIDRLSAFNKKFLCLCLKIKNSKPFLCRPVIWHYQ